jgi:pyrimidine operon attenuation protein/uracil phosphoribosyltransferase
MSTALPEVGALMDALAGALRGAVSAQTAIVGIHTGGVWIAERLHRELGCAQPLGTLDVALHRDDYGRTGLRPEMRATAIPFEVDGADILLVDDVLMTGRTIRAALNELFDFGRPARVRLAVLVDRGGRELPVAAEFTGARLDAPGDRTVHLKRDPVSDRLWLDLTAHDHR